MSVICSAEPLKRYFIDEFEQDGGIPKGSVSIKRNSYVETTSSIESISWELIYATHLLVASKLLLTTSDNPFSARLYSWIPLEALVAVGMLLKSYGNPDSLLFNTANQLEVSQNHPFAITTMVLPGQGQTKNSQQSQAPASSAQQASGTINRLIGSFARLLSCRRDGNGEPEQHQHTYGLDCYADSCNGVCRFRPPAESRELPEASNDCPICFEMFTNVIVTPCCSQKIDKHCLQNIFQTAAEICPYCRVDLSSLANSPDFAVREELQQDLPCSFNEPRGISSSQTASFDIHSRARGPIACNMIIMDENGYLLQCGVVFDTQAALRVHIARFHPPARHDWGQP
ncbi:hypothetical protein [Endozoicomonas sp. 8E]|uniref:hypothetical protein n=1 Tax=Endozoicomonas sp. 8E TaxID=3035692 RepID=UPI002938E4C0|nr:hypothetical protein [Endozoicomonas sp. 8E]WOG27326.1 hypothetical protein P6910_22690 [Endozoicomonas sp. 8E]